MHRRSFLAGAGATLATGVAGCWSGETTSAECRLTHELVESGGRGDPVASYRYEELGDRARRAVRRAVEDGSYATTDSDEAAPEFRYWDEAALYEVEYEGETRALLTYGGEGCEPK